MADRAGQAGCQGWHAASPRFFKRNLPRIAALAIPGKLLSAIQAGSMQRQDTEGYRARFNLHVAATRAKRTVNIMTPQHDPSPLRL